MLLSILSRLGAGQQLLTPAESDPRAPQVLLGVPRLGGAAQAPRSPPQLSSHHPLLNWENHLGCHTPNQVRDQTQVKNKLFCKSPLPML